MRRGQSPGRRSSLGISEASGILGVSEATLRQWTDEGKVRAFVTPGGHRRYSKSELQQFMGTQRRIHGVKDLVAELEDTPSLQHEIAQTRFVNTSWYGKLTNESQQHLAEAGRRLLNLVVRYIAEPSKREEVVELVREVGRDFGDTLAKLGLPLTDSLEAFILHRNPVVNVATRLMKGREAFNERATEAVPLVTHIMDEALISLVAAHEKSRNAAQRSGNGGQDE